MKYALFEFSSEKTCEVGECRWITRESPETFNNAAWDSSKEIMVTWPREFSKLSKKIIKSTIDPDVVETTTCIARVIKFSDDYEDIQKKVRRYCDTGSTGTPNHGRGQRKPKRNARYLESDGEECDKTEKCAKRQQKLLCTSPVATKNVELQKLKEKYHFTETEEFESYVDIDDDDDDDEITSLKKKNSILQQNLREKEKEIAQLHTVIQNLKHMPILKDVVLTLKEQVERLNYSPRNSTKCLPVNMSSPTVHPAPSPISKSSGSSSPASSFTCESDVETDLVSIHPNITITKRQQLILSKKTTAKDFVYSIMAMLWGREILFTHSVTGKSSNAYKDKDAKPQLDPEKVHGICEFASKRYGYTEAAIRQIVISKISNTVKVIKAKQRLESIK